MAPHSNWFPFKMILNVVDVHNLSLYIPLYNTIIIYHFIGYFTFFSFFFFCEKRCKDEWIFGMYLGITFCFILCLNSLYLFMHIYKVKLEKMEPKFQLYPNYENLNFNSWNLFNIFQNKPNACAVKFLKEILCVFRLMCLGIRIISRK